MADPAPSRAAPVSDSLRPRPPLHRDLRRHLSRLAPVPRRGLDLPRRARLPVRARGDLLPHQDRGALGHAAARGLAAGEPADDGAAAGHRARPRRLDGLHAGAAGPSLRAARLARAGLRPRAALSGRHRLRHRALPALRRHRGDPPLGGLHAARRPHHRRVRGGHRGRQPRARAGRPHALPVVLGRLHVRGGAGLQSPPRARAARGGPDLLPRARRLRAHAPGPRPLDDQPAGPGGDTPARDHHRGGSHARARDAAPRRPAPPRAGARASRRPRRAVALSGGGRSALRRPRRRRARRLFRARRGGGGAPALRGRGARAPPARPQALGSALHRRGSLAPRDPRRPGGGGAGQRGGAPAGARLRARAGAEPPHPDESRQVRAAAGARADRGVAGGPLAGQARGRRQRAVRRHHRLHAAVVYPGPRGPRRPGGEVLRRLPRRDRAPRG